MEWRQRWRADALTRVHPVDDGLHGALRGVAVQDHAVSLLRLQVDLFLFLLCGESLRKQEGGGGWLGGCHTPVSARTLKNVTSAATSLTAPLRFPEAVRLTGRFYTQAQNHS